MRRAIITDIGINTVAIMSTQIKSRIKSARGTRGTQKRQLSPEDRASAGAVNFGVKQ